MGGVGGPEKYVLAQTVEYNNMTTIDLINDSLQSAEKDHKNFYTAINLLNDVVLELDGNYTISKQTIKKIETLLDNIDQQTIEKI